MFCLQSPDSCELFSCLDTYKGALTIAYVGLLIVIKLDMLHDVIRRPSMLKIKVCYGLYIL